MLKFKYKDGYFFCKSSYEKRHIPQKASWKFDKKLKCFYTKNLSHASRLMAYMGEAEKKFLKSKLIQVDQWPGGRDLVAPDGTIDYNKTGINPALKLKPHQVEPIHFVLDRNKSYLDACRGSGKTIIAAMVSNAFLENVGEKEKVVIYICPAFLQLNVEEEFKRWCPKYDVCLIDNIEYLIRDNHIIIVPDSLLSKGTVTYLLKKKLENREGLIFIDEAHRFKKEESLRSSALFGDEKREFEVGLLNLDGVKKHCFMSGTPMPNGRPIEIWPFIKHSALECVDFMTFKEFGKRYCGAYFDKKKFAFNYNGASNLKELAKKLIYPKGPFFYKIKKSALNLPAMNSQIIVVGKIPKNTTLMKLEKSVSKLGIEDTIKKTIASKKGVGEDELHIAEYRRLLGKVKVEYSAPGIKERLKEGNERMIIFCLHTEVIDMMTDELKKFDPIVIDGRISHKEKFKRAKEFQAHKGKRPLIGQIDACSLGLNLTAANTVDLFEFSYVPGDNDQCGGRANRIGQDEPVMVNYHVFKDTHDRKVIENILVKEGHINAMDVV